LLHPPHQLQQKQRQDEFRQCIVVHRGGHRHVHRHEGHESRRAQGDNAGEKLPRQPVGRPHHPRTQQHREEPQRQERPTEGQVNRHGQEVVEGRLVELVADGFDGHIRGEAAALYLLQVLMGVIAHLEHGQPSFTGDVSDVVVVGGFIGSLPGRSVKGVEGADGDVGQNDGDYQQAFSHQWLLSAGEKGFF